MNGTPHEVSRTSPLGRVWDNSTDAIYDTYPDAIDMQRLALDLFTVVAWCALIVGAAWALYVAWRAGA